MAAPPTDVVGKTVPPVAGSAAGTAVDAAPADDVGASATAFEDAAGKTLVAGTASVAGAERGFLPSPRHLLTYGFPVTAAVALAGREEQYGSSLVLMRVTTAARPLLLLLLVPRYSTVGRPVLLQQLLLPRHATVARPVLLQLLLLPRHATVARPVLQLLLLPRYATVARPVLLQLLLLPRHATDARPVLLQLLLLPRHATVARPVLLQLLLLPRHATAAHGPPVPKTTTDDKSMGVRWTFRELAENNLNNF